MRASSSPLFRSPLFAALLAALPAILLATLEGCSGASNGLGGAQPCQGTQESTPCGNGQSIAVCTNAGSAGSAGGCGTITYSVGGQSFSCSSCQAADCQQAAQEAVHACLSGGGNQGSSTSVTDGGVVNAGDSGAAGQHRTCTNPVACGQHGTYEECTVVDTAGACQAIEYVTSDGRTFTCGGCADCTAAAQDLGSYCAGSSASDAGTGGTSCSSAVACGSNGVTYEECTTTASNGVCDGATYQLSNGKSFACASCSDCSSASQQLESYCQSQGTPTTSCAVAQPCESSSLTYQSCTTSLNGACQSTYYETNDGQMFQCASCNDCSSAITQMQSYCNAQTPTTSCGSAASCSSTGVTDQLCTTSAGGACQSMYYTTSDGQTFQCASCSDCSAASASMQSYCASLSGTTCGSTTCSAGNLCCNCSGAYQCLSSGSGQYTCASYGCQ